MKYSVNLHFQIKRSFISSVINRLYAAGCSVNRLELEKKDDAFETYTIDVVYPDDTLFNALVSEFKKDEKNILAFEFHNILDEKIKSRLITVSSEIEFKNDEEYDIYHCGAYDYLTRKIKSGIDVKDIILSNVCLASFLKASSDDTTRQLAYIENEKNVGVVSKFTSFNAYPMVMTYQVIDDLPKLLQFSSYSFRIIRVGYLLDNDDPAVYSDLIDSVSVPLLSYNTDERVIKMLSAVLYSIRSNKKRSDDVNVGIFGLDSAAARLTRIIKANCSAKVLGYDNNESSMMVFEDYGGLATTAENIAANCDLLLVCRDLSDDIALKKLRPGIAVVSSHLSEHNEFFSKASILRSFHRFDQWDTSVLLPGLISGLARSGKRAISDEMIFKIASYIAGLDNLHIFPSIFSDVHGKIEEIVVSEQ